MKIIKDYLELEELILKGESFLLYAASPSCGVCHANQARVEDLAKSQDFPAYLLDTTRLSQAVGQLSLMSVPVVILFFQGKEWHRQARFIDFHDLAYRLGQIKEGLSS